jgi:shikimate kinase/3-dehydroquinate synthase
MTEGIIFLYGPSGSGKSLVGEILAEVLNLAFIDLDAEIEASSGQTIPEIFFNEGESGFRKRESQALGVALTPGEKIIALGGGALTVLENRQIAEKYGQIILLNAPVETLVERLQKDPTQRPLLVGNTQANLKDLLARRKEHYASFPLQISTDDKPLAEIAWEIQRLLGKFSLGAMATKQHPAYDVRVITGGLSKLGEMLKARNLRGPVAVVTDENIGKLYLARAIKALTNSGYDAQGITIPAGEDYKTLEILSQLWNGFLHANIERSSTVVALGGGVIGDMAGFAAGTFLRGVPWVAVPTTLLAMVDASLGGKTGADLPQGKNLIGAFNPPRLVLTDPEVLRTLPEEEFISGMAEVIKHGVIADPWLIKNLPCDSFAHLRGNLEGLEEIIRRAMAVKIKIIEQDPFEKGYRAALNYGHTVGHGVELVSGFKLRHGEAVAIGMVIESLMSEQINLAQPGLASDIAEVLTAIGLPTQIPNELDRSAIISAMLRDKKKADGLVLYALPRVIGDVQVGIVIDGWESIVLQQ